MANDRDCTQANCPHAELLARARSACLSCTRGGEPSGRGGRVSYEAAGDSVVYREAVYLSRDTRRQVTSLPPNVEDCVAELFRRWSALDTIDALLTLHVSNGGTLDTFGKYLSRVRSAIDSLKPERPSMRATAWAKFKALLRRFPMLDNVRSWSTGHGGAIRRERLIEERDEAQMELGL